MLPGLLSAGAGAAQILFGLIGKGQKKRAANEAIDATPVYEKSKYEVANLQSAEAKQNAAMPGEAEAKQQIGQSATQALGAAKTRKGGLGSIAGIQETTNKAKQGLAVKKAEFKLGAERELSAARGRMTGELNKEFQSRQQKQSLKTQQALGELAGANQSISQGFAGLGSGLAMNQAYGSGKASGIWGKIGLKGNA